MAPVIVDEAVREFLLESHENLDKLDREFVELEKGAVTPERVASIFRTIHTIKGTAGFLGYSKLESLTHAGETLLAKLREGALQFNPEIISGLLSLVDKVRLFLRSIEADGTESAEDTSVLKAALLALSSGEKAPVAEIAEAPVVLASPELAQGVEIPQVLLAPELVMEAPAPPVEEANEVAAWNEASSSSSVSDTRVRVDVALLDKLMNLVGELVLARNQILRFGNTLEPGLASATQRLNLVTTELQEGVMKTRMQPISQVWNKLPRVVRDVAVACGKQVRVEMVGKDTELDRTIIEAIRDPLTHVVRNAIDHGIESPEIRGARKKPRTGLLTLRAFHEGGQVNIEISDDGGGLDLQAIRQKGISKGFITAEQATRMSERELLQLIFLPGFSTANKVSNISGRGVGMDVVKTNIEQIGGTVDMQSQLGVGTTLKFKIPLTLAIIPALMVTSRYQKFAIPQVSLLELVRLDQNADKVIEHIHQAPVFRLRGKLLPLVDLDQVLGMSFTSDAAPQEKSDTRYIVVLQADDRQFGLIVDEVHDTEEIVVKPLGTELKSINVFAGATIMGDGGVSLILDVAGIAQKSGAIAASKDKMLSAPMSDENENPSRRDEKQSLLVFRVGEEGRMAVPLGWVARLEEFPFDTIEHAGGHHVVQYRGEILPLIELRRLFGDDSSFSDSKPVSVVVYSHQGRTVGLIVDEILDIIDENILVTQKAIRHGTRGAAVIQGKVTELLDMDSLVREEFPTWEPESRHA